MPLPSEPRALSDSPLLASFQSAGASVVNLATWLWIDPAIWHSYYGDRLSGSVSATAVATPVWVGWSMGDGGSVVCHGPGTPFDPDEPAVSAVDAVCVHLRHFIGRAVVSRRNARRRFVHRGSHGPLVGLLVGSGCARRGFSAALTTSSSTDLRVEQVESINSLPGGGIPDQAGRAASVTTVVERVNGRSTGHS